MPRWTKVFPLLPLNEQRQASYETSQSGHWIKIGQMEFQERLESGVEVTGFNIILIKSNTLRAANLAESN
jgi:hypothetical protein